MTCSVGLCDDLKRKCAAYSGGMQRRLGIAQALLDDPDILILDEPTYKIVFATQEDVTKRMELVHLVIDGFLHLDEKQYLK